MTEPELTYLELNEDVGVAPSHVRDEQGREVPNPRAGELDPLNNVGIQVPVPVMTPDGKDVTFTTRRVPLLPALELDELLEARIMPGTRIVETRSPAVVNVLISTGQYHYVDPPAKRKATAAAKELADHMVAQGDLIRAQHGIETAALPAIAPLDAPQLAPAEPGAAAEGAPPESSAPTTNDAPDAGEEG